MSSEQPNIKRGDLLVEFSRESNKLVNIELFLRVLSKGYNAQLFTVTSNYKTFFDKYECDFNVENFSYTHKLNEEES